jgi:hypothetical protein
MPNQSITTSKMRLIQALTIVFLQVMMALRKIKEMKKKKLKEFKPLN